MEKKKKHKKHKKHGKKHKKHKKHKKKNKRVNNNSSDSSDSDDIIDNEKSTAVKRSASTLPNDDLEKQLRERALKSMKRQNSVSD